MSKANPCPPVEGMHGREMGEDKAKATDSASPKQAVVLESAALLLTGPGLPPVEGGRLRETVANVNKQDLISDASIPPNHPDRFRVRPTTLGTSRLILRPFQWCDAAAICNAFQDAEIRRLHCWKSTFALADAQIFVTETTKWGWALQKNFTFGAFARDDGRLVAQVRLTRLTLLTTQQQAELEYWTVREERGKEFAVEAARAVIEWAFDELGLERLEWRAEAGNEASRRVALKLGFHMEGTMRSLFVRDGVRRDAWVGSLLPSDCGRSSRMPYLPSIAADAKPYLLHIEAPAEPNRGPLRQEVTKDQQDQSCDNL